MYKNIHKIGCEKNQGDFANKTIISKQYINLVWRLIIIGNVNAGSVRIYKLNSFKTFTSKENELHKKKDYSALLAEIEKHSKTMRQIDVKHLNEANEVSVFEGDIIRLALSDRQIEKADYQLLDEIVYMEIYHNEIMEQIIKKGVMIANKKYVFYSATTGQVRNKTITLLEENFYNRHKGTLLVGLSIQYINKPKKYKDDPGGMNVGKFISYTALPLSSSVLPDKEIDIDRCILVKGLETSVTDVVKFVDIQKDSEGQHYVFDTPTEYLEKSIEIEHTDGAGMFLPGELPSSCQIRSGYFKGAMFPFDFRAFTKEIAHNTVVVDAWNKEVDIEQEDIRFIFTTSQLKMWRMYPSWDAYKKAFKENGIKLSINSYANPPKDIVNFAYQYLQTLPYGCDIEGICTRAKEDIEKMQTDFEYTKEVMGLTSDEEDDDNKKMSNAIIAEALNIYPQLIYDSYIQNKIKSFIRAKKRSYRAGKIPLKGYYSYAAPDMYAFCEYLFCGDKTPKGLVPKNYVYNKYFDNKGTVEHLICLRSPHLSNYEYGKRDLIKTEDCRKWFKYMESDTVVSCHDLLSKSLQMDWDGDEILVSDDEELYRLAESKPSVPLYYEMQQAEPQQINEDTLYETLVKGFDNNVIGESSNAITKLWNTPTATKDNSIPYDDAINVFCAYSNYAIDYPKTGKSLDLGDYQELYNKLVVPKKEFVKSDIPHPNFFVEAKGKKKNSVAPLTHNVMDRIKQSIGTCRCKPHYFPNIQCDNFDYRMLMNCEVKEDGTEKYKVDRYNKHYESLYYLLKKRKKGLKRICVSVEKAEQRNNMDSEKKASQFDVFHYHCIREIRNIFTDSKGFFNCELAVNYLVDLEYAQPDFVTSSKDILWKCFGHILVKNLQRNINGGVDVIKYRPRLAYIKAKTAIDSIDKKIKTSNRSVVITKDDIDTIDKSLKHYKNGNTYNNDREILFVLYCLYKEAEENNRLTKDGYFKITRRKHFVDYQATGNKPRKKKLWFNMNKVISIAGVKSYKGSLERFSDTPGIDLVDDKTKDEYRIRFNVPKTASETLFEVRDIYNSMMYLNAFKQGKEPCICKVCGNDFVKTSNNQKTCSDECKNELHKINQKKTNEKIRLAAIQSKQAI